MNCVEGEGSYAGTALTVDYMKSTAFAAKIERLVQDEQFLGNRPAGLYIGK